MKNELKNLFGFGGYQNDYEKSILKSYWFVVIFIVVSLLLVFIFN